MNRRWRRTALPTKVFYTAKRRDSRQEFLYCVGEEAAKRVALFLHPYYEDADKLTAAKANPLRIGNQMVADSEAKPAGKSDTGWGFWSRLSRFG